MESHEETAAAIVTLQLVKKKEKEKKTCLVKPSMGDN